MKLIGQQQLRSKRQQLSHSSSAARDKSENGKMRQHNVIPRRWNISDVMKRVPQHGYNTPHIISTSLLLISFWDRHQETIIFPVFHAGFQLQGIKICAVFGLSQEVTKYKRLKTIIFFFPLSSLLLWLLLHQKNGKVILKQQQHIEHSEQLKWWSASLSLL